MEPLMKTRLDKLVHDVRNPLNAISVNAELAKLLLDHPGSGEQVRKALDTILQECRKCNDVLNLAPDYFPD
jgi:signal transduction histidine kinase